MSASPNLSKTAALVLDPHDPMASARALVAASFTSDGHRCLHHHLGAFYSWNGACYRPVDDGTIRAQTWDFLDRAVLIGRDGSTAPFRPNQSRVNNVIDALAAVSNLPGHVTPPTWLLTRGNEPSAAEMLPVANGLLHLPSGKLHLATPAFFGLYACNLRYDPDASAPQRWLGFLSEVFGDDIEAIETLQETMGYALTPDTSQQKILLMVGPTRCGKGTIARTLTELVGRDNVAAPTLASLSTNFGLAPLIGKPLAIIADARLGSRSDPAAIAERLLSVSGEDALTIDRKFQPAWTGRLPTRFVVLTNELPRLVDASGALAKRFVVLTMQRSFLGREDHGLTGKLLAELPGILNWARKGFLRLRARGYFVQPASSREAIEDLEALGSPIGAFIKECCEVKPSRRVAIDHIYQAWRDWCEANGRREPGTKQEVGRQLKACVPGIRVTQPRDLPGRPRVYEGLGLLPEVACW